MVNYKRHGTRRTHAGRDILPTLTRTPHVPLCPLCSSAQNLTILPPTLHFVQLPKQRLWRAMPALTQLLMQKADAGEMQTLRAMPASCSQQPDRVLIAFCLCLCLSTRFCCRHVRFVR